MLQFEEVQKREHLKRVIEALLFATNEALPIDKIREITDTVQPLSPRILRTLLQEMQVEYRCQNRAFRLEEIAQGFVLRSCEEYSSYIAMLYRNKRAEKLSHAAAEVLAIIAYRQPITKPQVEAIRGVDSTSAFQVLTERQLIQPAGKLEAPGRPTLYETTKEFLHHFGLRAVADLPPLQQTKENERKQETVYNLANLQSKDDT